MSELRAPLREQLSDEVSEAEIHRVWLGVQRRRARRRTPIRRPQLRLLVPIAAIAALAAMVLIFYPRTDAGPLLAPDGGHLAHIGGARPAAMSLSDGSRIELTADSELEVLDNDGKAFVSVLRKGRGTFEVKPGGPRRWRIEAGLVNVEVIGTRFRVDRQAERVAVHVDRGVVLVRGDLVPDRVQRLAAGGHIVIEKPPEKAASRREPSEPPVEARVLAPNAAEPAPAPESSSPKPPLSAAPSTEPATLDELLQKADAERRSGRVGAAIATLEKTLEQHAAEPRSALVAFTLAKLLLDAAGRPQEAEHALLRCLAASPPAALAEDALARLVQARAQAGKWQAARETAAEYRQRYPNGRRLADVQRWSEAH